MPFCSETTTVSGPASGAIVSSAACVSCDLTARNTVPSGPRSSEGTQARAGTVNSFEPVMRSPRAFIAETCSATLSTKSRSSPACAMWAPTIPPIAPAP